MPLFEQKVKAFNYLKYFIIAKAFAPINSFYLRINKVENKKPANFKFIFHQTLVGI